MSGSGQFLAQGADHAVVIVRVLRLGRTEDCRARDKCIGAGGVDSANIVYLYPAIYLQADIPARLIYQLAGLAQFIQC